MANVKIDTIEEGGITETETSIEIKRSFFVSCIAGSGIEILPNAVAAAGIPAMYDAHPVVPLCLCRKRSVVGKAHNQALVVCTYIFETNKQDPSSQGPVWEVDSGVTAEPTSFDKDGIIQVKYSLLKDVNGETFNPTPVLTGMYPTLVIRGTTFLRSAPLDKALDNVGCVNKSTWAGKPKHTWLCMGIPYKKLTPNLFQATYVFEYKPQTWRQLAVVRDPHGRIPKKVADDITKPLADLGFPKDGDGWKVVLLNDEKDFNGAFGDPKIT